VGLILFKRFFQCSVIVRCEQSRMINSWIFLGILQGRAIWGHCSVVVAWHAVILDGWKRCAHYVHSVGRASLGKVGGLMLNIVRLTTISISILNCCSGILVGRVRIMSCMSLPLVIRSMGHWLKIKYVSLYIRNRRIGWMLHPPSSLCWQRRLNSYLCLRLPLNLSLIIT